MSPETKRPRILGEVQVWPDPEQPAPKGAIRVLQRLIEESDGQQRDQYIWKRQNFVMVVPMAPDGRLYMKMEWKYGVMEKLLTFAAGAIKSGEDPVEAGRRELREEFALKSDHWISLGKFRVSPDKSTEGQHLFLARDCSPANDYTPEPGEIVVEETQDLLARPEMTIALCRLAIHEARLALLQRPFIEATGLRPSQ